MSDVPTQPGPAGPATLGDGRYVVHERLGVGGMGIVLAATDTRLDRRVAVKLLADNLAADDVARQRFLREAQAAARVDSPHVVQVYDVAEEDGRPYFVMELVEGESLAQQLARSGPLDPDDVVGIAADALAGLAQAHEAGVLHRDVKPGNLLRTPSGAVKVTDFGVAQAVDEDLLTRTGMVVGTGPYLAPERAAGQAATPRTDLYALGATLHELLTGQRPAPDGSLGAVDAPPRLRRLLERLLAREPQQRPASAEAALALLADGVDPGEEDATAALHAQPGPISESEDDGSRDDTVRVDTVRGDAVGAGAVASATGEEPEDGPPAPPGARRGPALAWRTVAVVAVALLVIVVGVQLLGDDAEEPEAPPNVERAEEPAETARNLARWLEERAGD